MLPALVGADSSCRSVQGRCSYSHLILVACEACLAAPKISPHAACHAQDDNDKSKGFGFINFEDATAARAAVDALDGQEVDGSKLWAGRAQKKSERESELKNRCARPVTLGHKAFAP